MAWAVEGDLDPEKMTSNSFAMIWPPKSGVLRQFPEADRGDWFARQEASRRILPGQRPILDAFFQLLPDIRSGSKKK
jgi:predicted NUDIX family NTP pyrophosphohydrolase